MVEAELHAGSLFLDTFSVLLDGSVSSVLEGQNMGLQHLFFLPLCWSQRDIQKCHRDNFILCILEIVIISRGD